MKLTLKNFFQEYILFPEKLEDKTYRRWAVIGKWICRLSSFNAINYFCKILYNARVKKLANGTAESNKTKIVAGQHLNRFSSEAQKKLDILLTKITETCAQNDTYIPSVAEKEEIKALMQQGAQLDAKKQPNSNRTYLHDAVGTYKLNLVEFLAPLYKNYLEVEDARGQTPLLTAVSLSTKRNSYRRNDPDYVSTRMCEILIENGADIDAASTTGETPLLLAAEKGKEPIMRLFLDKGASLRVKNDENENILHAAVRGGDEECLRLAINRIPKNELPTVVDAQNDRKSTPLRLAASEGKALAMQLLLDAGAAVDLQKNRIQQIFNISISNGNRACVEALLNKIPKNQHDSVVNAINYRGPHILSLAIQSGKMDIVQLLLDKGSSVLQKDYQDKSVLQNAIESGDTKCIRLIYNKIPRNRRDEQIQSLPEELKTTLFTVVQGD